MTSEALKPYFRQRTSSVFTMLTLVRYINLLLLIYLLTEHTEKWINHKRLPGTQTDLPRSAPRSIFSWVEVAENTNRGIC